MINVLALHGFLGKADDWNALRSTLSDKVDWTTPELFRPGSEFCLNSFSSLVGDLEQQPLGSPKHLLGYSFGGRVALELFKKNPENWESLTLLAAHPGLNSETDQRERKKQQSVWADRFRNWNWRDVMKAWNSQSVLKKSPPLDVEEACVDREQLVKALENLSVADQKRDLAFLRDHRERMFWLVGDQDEKYLKIYTELRDQGHIQNLTVLKGCGHRILKQSNENLSTQLEANWNL